MTSFTPAGPLVVKGHRKMASAARSVGPNPKPSACHRPSEAASPPAMVALELMRWLIVVPENVASKNIYGKSTDADLRAFK